MDTKPLAGSMNPVTSNGIFEALQEAGSRRANKALDNLALPLEWAPGTMPEGNLYGTYWEAQGLFVGANTIDEAEAVYTTKDGSSWELFAVGITDFVPTYPIASSNDMLVISGLNGQKIDLAVTWDGGSWITALSKKGITNVYTAEYSGKYYIATNKNDVIVSTNKETFSVVALPSLGSANYTIMGMCSTKNAIIILFCDILSALNNKIVYSSNGSDWNVYEIAGATSYGHLASNGITAVRIPQKQANSMESAYFSKNGSSWSESEFDFSAAKRLLCDGARFLAFNDTNGNAMISFDGESWETEMLPVSLADTMLAGGGGRFILGKYSASEIYLTTAPAKTMKNLQPIINGIMADIPSGGGGGSDIAVIDLDLSSGTAAEDAGILVRAAVQAGKAVCLRVDGGDGSVTMAWMTYLMQDEETSGAEYQFSAVMGTTNAQGISNSGYAIIDLMCDNNTWSVGFGYRPLTQ